MIGKIPKGRRDRKSSFRDLINYCLGVTGHSQGAVLYIGKQNINDTQTAAVEMESLAMENVRCKSPAFHFILSWRSDETPTNGQVDEAVSIALKELDLSECQAVWGLQSDTDNLHVHVAVNRISPKTFKAIKPARGWTKKALERAARKIEISQGWDVEHTGRYLVDAMGNIYEKNSSEIIQPDVSQVARDIETHTGEESFERSAKREIAPILSRVFSWDELHRELAKRGYILERRGNGAVISSGEKFIKLSKISRESSLSKLEKRLGKYQERDISIQIIECPKTVSFLSEKSSWGAYRIEKEEYLQSKLEAIKKLREKQKTERENLYHRQKDSRKELFSQSWKGRGKELNQLKSIFAFVHRKEQIELREQQNDEMQKLRSHFLKRFPSFRDWVLAQSREDEYRLYRYPGQLLLSPEQSGIKIPQSQHRMDLRDYSVRRGAGSKVLYCRAGTYTADFSDMGKIIVLNKRKLTEESVAAALQLANQKWGATQITGNAEYKELCISAAVKYGLKLANPDLIAEVERRRQALKISQSSNLEITAEEISKLKLAENPKIYINPRTDNQQYSGQIVHVDEKRGICIQLVGQRSLFVHRLEKLERLPLHGETLKILYTDENHRAKIQREENRHQTRSL
ncbi:MAG: relaxase/mobilization nuclease domain-containing protein [Synergistaceae bacterium]|nr:relaxase/mobilization nuclease domain-containing protein [Synergistaceae bacterium]